MVYIFTKSFIANVRFDHYHSDGFVFIPKYNVRDISSFGRPLKLVK